MTYKVITTTGGTPYQPAVPATGTEGIIVLPANSVSGDGSDAVKTTLTKTANVVIPVDGDVVYSEQSTVDRVIFSVPSDNITSTAIRSNTIFYALPKKNLTDGNARQRYSCYLYWYYHTSYIWRTIGGTLHE